RHRNESVLSYYVSEEFVRFKRKGRKNQRGQALLIFAVFATILLGTIALVLDVGWAYYGGKKAQTAVDAAAGAAIATAISKTAAIRSAKADASLYLLNRHSDCFVSALNIGAVCGEDFLALGANSIHARNGIYMASSNKTGLGLPQIAAGTVVGDAQVQAPFTY